MKSRVHGRRSTYPTPTNPLFLNPPLLRLCASPLDEKVAHRALGRRAQAHSVTRGRVPPSTPGALGSSLSSHSHIQVVSRDESEPAEGDYTYEDDTPTFRSPSLQYIAQTQQVDKFEGEQPKARTFADMARNYTKLDMDGQEKPTSGPIPLARLVKLQPNSRKTNNTNISSADGTYSIVDKYAHLFGKLPDQIHLHEKMGEFDGQTIFIGHPNRDVSAHQWSASSFQWVNIGRFSHSSGRVEGSLASDRVKGVNAHPHSIEYFKIAAEAREKVIRENGRQDEVSQLPRSVRPGLTGARRLASLSSASSPEDHFTSHMKLSHQGPQFENRAVATTPALGTVIQEPLEDPFRRVAVPDVSTLHKPIPPLMPPPGLTVANPYRVSSRLNAQAPPYTHTSSELQNISASSEKPADDTLEASNLHFSDPDAAAQPDGYEVANGFIQGLPTPQNWNGPWFTQSMPTTHDPTASLYLPEDDETKLTKWYRDGQRYARQQDYTKSLIATANAGPKPRNLGVIGGGPVPGKIAGPDEFENTHQFVRLYEILNEYAEEYAAGSGKSYFTRHWKPAPESMRDMGPDGNNSFFKDVRAPSPKAKQAPAKVPEVRAPSGWPAPIYETRPSPFSRGTTFMTLRNSPGTATSAVSRELQHLRW
ncbi:hypothetical protein BS50DRAFT_662585 [Corynespora cassiicola Philippines]|uniref:Uncharacterized protein n=1 Tax=Corynespora cassiicola Philippines TaxID=1448308 RepID=A0A2T2NYB7_CORCC|nr:hypothetical protein BS50DRAFT_662585 [Corynespora cassiicola Philippines]